MAVTLASDEAAAPAMGAGGAPRMGIPEGRNFQEKITKAATDAVKGAGRFTKGRDLDDGVDGAEIFTKSHDAIMRTKAAMAHGVHDSDSVIGGWSSDFQRHEVFAPLAYRAKADAEVRKNFTAQNLGSSGAPYGLVPSSGGFGE